MNELEEIDTELPLGIIIEDGEEKVFFRQRYKDLNLNVRGIDKAKGVEDIYEQLVNNEIPLENFPLFHIDLNIEGNILASQRLIDELKKENYNNVFIVVRTSLETNSNNKRNFFYSDKKTEQSTQNYNNDFVKILKAYRDFKGTSIFLEPKMTIKDLENLSTNEREIVIESIVEAENYNSGRQDFLVSTIDVQTQQENDISFELRHTANEQIKSNFSYKIRRFGNGDIAIEIFDGQKIHPFNFQSKPRELCELIENQFFDIKNVFINELLKYLIIKNLACQTAFLSNYQDNEDTINNIITAFKIGSLQDDSTQYSLLFLAQLFENTAPQNSLAETSEKHRTIATHLGLKIDNIFYGEIDELDEVIEDEMINVSISGVNNIAEILPTTKLKKGFLEDYGVRIKEANCFRMIGFKNLKNNLFSYQVTPIIYPNYISKRAK